MKLIQCARILSVLDAAGHDFLVERTPTGWRVETEALERGADGLSCEGVSLIDALAQVATVLAVDLDVATVDDAGIDWLHDAPDDVDEVRVTLEAPVEFCPVLLAHPTQLRVLAVGASERDDFMASMARNVFKGL